MQHRTVLASLGPLLLLACSSSNDAAPPPPASPAVDDAGPPPASPSPVAWTPCSLYSEGDGPDAECVTLDVPLSRGEPQGKTIPFFVKRYHRAGTTPTKALWMLQGGPGGSGYALERLAEAIATKFGDVEFYIPDHRGTGRSSRIGCRAEEESSPGGRQITGDEWPACLDEAKATWGAGLASFSTTNAANDVALAIGRTRTEGQPVFVYGVSYGTYWAHRIMQIAPKVADGFVLDSMAPPGASLARQDQDANEGARELLNACAADAFCKSKLGDDPWGRATALATKLKSGHCPGLVVPEGFTTSVFFRLILGSLLMDVANRSLVPSLVYRADRCSDIDVKALNHFFAAATGEPPAEFTKQWGYVVSYNIIFSELWEEPSPTAADLSAWRDATAASREVTAAMEPIVGLWPRYKDELAPQFAGTDVPLLMLQGKLDPATLYRKALPMKAHFVGPTQHWVEVPTATHTVLSSSATTEGRSCGTRILMNFIGDPTGPLDTSCLSTLVPLPFTVGTPTSKAVYGKADPWE